MADQRPALLTRCTFPIEGDLQCAVSGGADSLALLALACHTGRTVRAFHVDHGLRPTSAADAHIVAQACRTFGAEFVALRVELDDGPNVEARARAARFAALPPGILTGHTADDQAETVLLNLMRGAGLDGLGAMGIDGHPILGLRRWETHQLCVDLALDPVQDESNSDPRFLRNRIRAELLPLMNDLAQRDVTPVIANASGHFRQAADYLNQAATEIDVTDAVALAAAPEELAGRAIRFWLRQHIDDELHAPDAKAVARVLAVARGQALSCEVAGGLRISRSRQRLQLQRTK